MSAFVPFWFIVIAILWTGFSHPGGVRLRCRHAAQRRRPGRRRAPGRDQHDRAAVGRQRGLADRGRGGHVRRVPRLVRHHVLRHVPRPGPAADVPDHPRGGVRVPGQAGRSRLAAHLGRGAHHRQRAGPAADRHRAGRPAGRAADRLGAELYRVVLGPVPALRRVDRGDLGPGVPAARRHVLVPEDHWRDARTIPCPGAPYRPVHRRVRHRLHYLDPRDGQHRLFPQRDRAAGDPGRRGRAVGWSTPGETASRSPRPA